MVRVKHNNDVPSHPDHRLDELAQILARGIHRLVSKKTGFSSQNPLLNPRKRGSMSPPPPEAPPEDSCQGDLWHNGDI